MSSKEACCIGCRYGNVTLSIHPQTHTEDMHSWFPIYFPLKEPLLCPAGAAIEAHIWRCSANHKARLVTGDAHKQYWQSSS